MTGSKTLMNALDAAASALLQRHFPKDLPEGKELPNSADQIKAFQAVTAYYGPRNKFGVDEEKRENGIDSLKRRLHGRRALGRSARAPQTGANGVASADDEPAGNA